MKTTNKSLVALALLLASTQSGAAEVVQFLGPSVGTTMDAVLTPTQIDDAGITNPDDYACFAIPMLDPATGNTIGTGVDCLMFHAIPGRVVNANGLANGRAFESLAGDVAVQAVSIFDFGGGNLLVTAGTTTAKPMLDGFGNGGEPARTHITGSIPDPYSNGVLLGLGDFAGSSGPVRVSGSLSVGAGIFFDCLWILDITQ